MRYSGIAWLGLLLSIITVPSESSSVHIEHHMTTPISFAMMPVGGEVNIEWVTIDQAELPAVTNSTQPPPLGNWNWTSFAFGFKPAEPPPSPLQAIETRLRRLNSGNVEAAFQHPGETGTIGGVWYDLSAGDTWGSTIVWPNPPGTSFNGSPPAAKTDNWSVWRRDFTMPGADVAPMTVDSRSFWGPWMVVQVSHGEIIWPVYYQAIREAQVIVENVTGGFVERFEPNTPAGGAQYPRRDYAPSPGVANPQYAYPGQFLVLRPLMPGQPIANNVRAGVYTDFPHLGAMAPGQSFRSDGTALVAGGHLKEKLKLVAYFCVANNSPVAGAITTNYYGWKMEWNIDYDQTVGATASASTCTWSVSGGDRAAAANMGQSRTAPPIPPPNEIQWFTGSGTNGYTFPGSTTLFPRFTTPP
jgi:hypothetical protein